MLHGAEVTAPRIDVKAAQLEITSPQNTSDYHSVTRTVGGSLSVPLNNPAATSAGGSFQHQVLKDHFVSTGKTLSGLYAGDQGIGIDVAGNTSLTAGVISSTASREKNHFSTGSLTAQNLENISRWQLESAGFQGSFGGAGQGDAHSWLGQVGQGMAANSMSLLGGGRDHDERTVSHSAVSDNITINTTGISGDLSRDVAHANGALTNKFDAQKLQNQMQASQLGTQLVGEIVGTAFQKVQERNDKARVEAGLPPEEAGGLFSRREVARDILEAGGAAGIAALTGGNPAAAGVGTLAGKVTAAATRPLAEAVATGLTGNSDGTLHDSIANLFSDIAAAGGGAVGGLVAGRSSASTNALTGAAAAAAIEQYNDNAHHGKEEQQTKEEQEKETKAVADAVLDTALTAGSMVPGPIGAAFGYSFAIKLANDGHPYLAALQSASATVDAFGIDTSVVVSPAITGSLWLAKSAVVGAVFKFGAAALERLAKVQFTAATAKETLLEMEGVHFPWRTGPGGDFIGEKGSQEHIRVIYTTESSEEAARRFYNDTVTWLKQNGLTPKSETISKGREETRFENIYKMDENAKRKDVFVGLRSGKESSFRTSNDVYTVDLGHPSGNGKFKFIQIEK